MKPFFEVDVAPFKRASRGNSSAGRGGLSCDSCSLQEKCKSPKMEPSGLGEKKILVLAEAPGREEDEKGTQLIGASGRYLRYELERIGIDLDRDCRKTNAVNCRPPDNRDPSKKEISCCRPRLLAEIESFRPKVILALGRQAILSLCDYRGGKALPGISSWQGFTIPDQEHKAWIVPTWHPAFLLRDDKQPLYERFFRRDLRRALSCLDKDISIVDYVNMVEVIVSPALAAKKLNELYRYLLDSSEPVISFDYETTGKKPYAEGHKIVSCSIAWEQSGEIKGIAFLTTEETWPLLYRILANPKIKKVAHNMKFERLWTMIRGWPGVKDGFEVQGLIWDAMLAAHVLDNRTGISGLKFQSYVNFGILGYDKEVDSYIRSTKDSGGNAFNKIEKAPIRELLLYNGMDSVLEHSLYLVQKEKYEKDAESSKAYKLFHDGSLTFNDMEMRGIDLDKNYCLKQQKHLERQIDRLQRKIDESPEVQEWQKFKGAKLNIDSPVQMSDLLYRQLEVPIVSRTDSGRPSVNAEALEEMDVPFVKHVISIRKLEKVTSYLEQFVREEHGGVIHPFFNLHMTRTQRSSSDSPNFQNIPKHDPEANWVTRRALFPPPGTCLLDIDYSGIEVRVGCALHRDPTMIAYLNDPETDMHRDAACDLFMLEPRQVTKPIRQGGKNCFVFPEFYGDYFKNIAKILWRDYVKSAIFGALPCDTTLKAHLKQKRIKDYADFEDHVRDCEDILWNERFTVYRDWKQENWTTYQSQGYLRSPLGFLFTAVMDDKQANNIVTQGTAFHFNLISAIDLNKVLKLQGFKSYIYGQIHDSINMVAYPDELNELLVLIVNICVKRLKERFADFLMDIPMAVEIELSPPNKSWYEVKEINRRPEPCTCGQEWGYKKRVEEAVIWSCPICDTQEV